MNAINFKFLVNFSRPVLEALLVRLAQADYEWNTLIQDNFLPQSPLFGSEDAFADDYFINFLFIQSWQFDDSSGSLLDICGKSAPITDCLTGI